MEPELKQAVEYSLRQGSSIDLRSGTDICGTRAYDIVKIVAQEYPNHNITVYNCRGIAMAGLVRDDNRWRLC